MQLLDNPVYDYKNCENRRGCYRTTVSYKLNQNKFAKRVESVKNVLAKKCIGKIIFIIVFAMLGLIIDKLKIIGFLTLKCREITVWQY